MKNAVSDGNQLNYTNGTGSTITGGTAFLLGVMVVVAQGDIIDGATGVVLVEGAYELPKTTGQAWAQGVALYWDDTAKKFTTTSSGNTLGGHAYQAALSADTTGVVLLLQ